MRRERAGRGRRRRPRAARHLKPPDCTRSRRHAVGVGEGRSSTLSGPVVASSRYSVVFLVALLLLAAVGAYAWDSSRSDEIAEGVTIGGVDVGGMTADEATEAVESELVDPLRKKVTVTYDGGQVPAQPREARGRLRRRRDGRPGARGEPGGRPADPRLALRDRRRGRRRDLAPGQLLQQRDRRVHRQGRRGGQPRAGRRDDRAERGLARPASRATTGVAVDEAALRRGSSRSVQRADHRKVARAGRRRSSPR